MTQIKTVNIEFMGAGYSRQRCVWPVSSKGQSEGRREEGVVRVWHRDGLWWRDRGRSVSGLCLGDVDLFET